MDELKPCKRCGSEQLSHGSDSPGIDGSPTTSSVECDGCGALLYRPTEAEAFAAWNSRTKETGEQS